MAKILLVDDSNLSRRILRRMLESDGHAILEASDGMAAIERYFLDQPELVLLDLTMHGMHGLDVLSKLREIDPRARDRCHRRYPELDAHAGSGGRWRCFRQ